MNAQFCDCIKNNKYFLLILLSLVVLVLLKFMFFSDEAFCDVSQTCDTSQLDKYLNSDNSNTARFIYTDPTTKNIYYLGFDDKRKFNNSHVCDKSRNASTDNNNIPVLINASIIIDQICMNEKTNECLSGGSNLRDCKSQSQLKCTNVPTIKALDSDPTYVPNAKDLSFISADKTKFTITTKQSATYNPDDTYITGKYNISASYTSNIKNENDKQNLSNITNLSLANYQTINSKVEFPHNNLLCLEANQQGNDNMRTTINIDPHIIDSKNDVMNGVRLYFMSKNVNDPFAQFIKLYIGLDQAGLTDNCGNGCNKYYKGLSLYPEYLPNTPGSETKIPDPNIILFQISSK